jgi:hypothetical protein
LGTHQIMLVILSVVLMGIAIAFGLFMFRMHAVNTNRQLMINDMNFLGAEALRFWRTPRSMGGGAPDITSNDQERLEFFLHWSGSTNRTASGTYSILANDDGTLDIIGIGTELGRDSTNPVRAIMTVNPGADPSMVTTIEN